jgi:hypothetical protein
MECSYCNEIKSRNYGNFIFQADYWIVFLVFENQRFSIPRTRSVRKPKKFIEFFEDPDFGRMKHMPIRKIPDDIRKKIIAKIKENF